MTENRLDNLFSLKDQRGFEEMALEIFRFQAEQVPVYKSFIQHLGCAVEKVSRLWDIPFLPITFFTKHRVAANGKEAPLVFLSSGTTSAIHSRHEVHRPDLYIQSFSKGFEHFYGKPEKFCIIGLLPSYLEQGNSSLVYMVDHLIKASNNPSGGFYLNQYESLSKTLDVLSKQQQQVMLIGVSYALLDMAEKFPADFPGLIVIETGGMKGRRRELIREELHQILSKGFGVKHIHSEYGMTELLSQAYSSHSGLFRTPPWMKVMIREMDDPFSQAADGRTGGINVIDLANVFSCSFIATQDLGRMHPDGSFEVLGRFDNSDARGCNLMIS